ncbi:Secernin-2-like protein [Dinothrombium tinctorium]|uniref:Secernin-2-like protein n=1 Tax=Dinothrombium tinctorium TaxID=1965070 RepID=A0A443RQ13_9ACAR|nr:Secernin-2-like protein [Dinothrombium tinctorium]
MSAIVSCDSFVVFPPLTADGVIVFGKNSDRPRNEVQEVVFCSRSEHETGTRLKCTYIEIEQSEETNAVILSKPSWMWGAEMGANEFGVCIGNEAVWTRVPTSDEEKLLGMDLVRLGLERGKTAREALEVITTLLEKYGQGGPCSDTIDDFSYHNSFLIVDREEAWVLETAGHLWAAERIQSGFRNISNCLSITTKIDLMSSGLKDEAKSMGLWDESSEFDFSKIFSIDGTIGVGDRYTNGCALLQQYSKDNDFNVSSMMKILRDEESGICRRRDASFPTQGSQVSVLSPKGSRRPDCHWFTGTPDPINSVFKPFIFVKNVKLSAKIRSPEIPEDQDPAKIKPRFEKKVDRRHPLYLKHEQFHSQNSKSDKEQKVRETLQEMEKTCINEVEEILKNYNLEDEGLELEELFNDSVEAEYRFYK